MLSSAVQVTYRSGTNASIGDEPVFNIKSYALVDLQAGFNFGDGRYHKYGQTGVSWLTYHPLRADGERLTALTRSDFNSPSTAEEKYSS
jgi:hypothetical protein